MITCRAVILEKRSFAQNLLKSYPFALRAASHHLDLLGSQGFPAADGLRAGAVRGPGGAQGVQPAAAVPAEHRQLPAGRQGHQQADPAPAALLVPHHRLHTNNQGKEKETKESVTRSPPSVVLLSADG